MNSVWEVVSNLGAAELVVGLLITGAVWGITFYLLVRPGQLGQWVPRPSPATEPKPGSEVLAGRLHQALKRLEENEVKLARMQESLQEQHSQPERSGLMRDVQDMRAKIDEALKNIRPDGK